MMSKQHIPAEKRRKRTALMDRSDIEVEVLAYVLVSLCVLLAVIPCIHVVARSFSKGTAVISGMVTLWPINPQIEGYRTVLRETEFLRALGNTLLVTFVGTAASMIASILFAYPLSKTELVGRKFFILLCMIVMVFNGGMVPNYLLMRGLGLLDSFSALIFPALISVFNMLIIKNYFESLPESVLEYAAIDGAGDFRTLVSIVCPLSMPVLATVTLLYAIHYWNNYFNAMLYILDPYKVTLQVFIRNFIADAGTLVNQLERTAETMGNLSTGVIIACATVLGIIPIVALYPFVQRFMLQGITIGSEKG